MSKENYLADAVESKIITPSLLSGNGVKEKAKRYNKDKPELTLLPQDALIGAARVLMFGKIKYDAYNWAIGLSWNQTMDSLMRHLGDFKEGKNIDEESKLPHIDHVLVNAMFLSVYQKRNLGTDDRFKWK